MATVYTTTIDTEDLYPAQVEDIAHANAVEFFGTDRVTVELLSWDITANTAVYRIDRQSGTLLG
jgi:hypothetical protein